jgi:hypothetical protein
MPDGALGCVGQKQERAERKKVLALAQARKVDVILVTELTPLGPLGQVALRCNNMVLWVARRHLSCSPLVASQSRSVYSMPIPGALLPP